MSRHEDIWRQRVWVWLVPALFLLANVSALAVYEIGYADRVETLRQRIQEQRLQSEQQRSARMNLEKLLRTAQLNRERIHTLYAESFSTRRRRLIEATAEVKTLAAKAGLLPRSLSYPEQQIQQYGLIKHSFVFSVEGSYLELRKLINLLELSESFLTLESVSLSESGGRGGKAAGRPLPGVPGQAPPGQLHIDLALSTLFAKAEPDEGSAALPGAEPAAERGGERAAERPGPTSSAGRTAPAGRGTSGRPPLPPTPPPGRSPQGPPP
ncbi:MAG TPA: hypothetical protein VHR45_03025 [Thermoanaerobaculia bacterium]|nr:hypothetical protein [Thermoanaerobaculia bacterium]